MAKSVKPETILKAVKAEVEANGLRPTARRIGCDPSDLLRVVRGQYPLSDTICCAYGFERIKETRITYRRKESSAQVA